jgi:2-oxoglutarate ferredoxin oxidoreductase subunit alpha
VNESSENAIAQMKKRMKKMNALKESLPEPDLFMKDKSGNMSVVQNRNSENIHPPKTPSENEEHRRIDVLLIGWGSTKSVTLDVLQNTEYKKDGVPLTVAYLHFTTLWPLKTELFEALIKEVKQTILIEGNFTGQLGILLRQETGINITDKILKYDGRPFFRDELAKKIDAIIMEHESPQVGDLL